MSDSFPKPFGSLGELITDLLDDILTWVNKFLQDDQAKYRSGIAVGFKNKKMVQIYSYNLNPSLPDYWDDDVQYASDAASACIHALESRKSYDGGDLLNHHPVHAYATVFCFRLNWNSYISVSFAGLQNDDCQKIATAVLKEFFRTKRVKEIKE